MLMNLLPAIMFAIGLFAIWNFWKVFNGVMFVIMTIVALIPVYIAFQSAPAWVNIATILGAILGAIAVMFMVRKKKKIQPS